MSDTREPPLEIELEEMLARRASDIIRLADVLQKNRERRQGKSDLPPFDQLPRNPAA